MLLCSRGDGWEGVREEIESLVSSSNGVFSVAYHDSSALGRATGGEVAGWDFSPLESMTYVCGTDEFVEFWGGGQERDEKGKKIQGELKGILGSMGVRAEEVYKF